MLASEQNAESYTRDARQKRQNEFYETKYDKDRESDVAIKCCKGKESITSLILI